MDIAIDLTPKGTKTRRIIDIFNDRHSWSRRLSNVSVVGNTSGEIIARCTPRRFCRPNFCCSRVANHWNHGRVSAYKWGRCETRGTTIWCNNLYCITDCRSVEISKCHQFMVLKHDLLLFHKLNEFYKRHGRIITLAWTQFQDSGIAAGPIFVSRPNFIDKFLSHLLVAV